VSKAAKNAFFQKRSEEKFEQMLKDPRKFHKWFGGQQPGVRVGSVNEWTEYFSRLYNTSASAAYRGGTIDTHCNTYPEIYGEPPEEMAPNTNNIPFTTEELTSGLKALRLGKAAGPDRIPAEFYRQAYIEHSFEDPVTGRRRFWREYVLAPTLATVFNKLQDSGGFYQPWAMGSIAPVPKPKGNPLSMDDHRGIAMGPALGKLFSLMLMKRLDGWAENDNLRAETQFGFRPKRGTLEGCFLLKHVVDSHTAQGKPLFAAFIDFKKAYDSVDRQLLWKSLQALGLQGWSLSVLQAMYSDVQLRARVGGDEGESFPSTRGVKQGDPLSPLLFGLFIDKLVGFLNNRLPGVGVEVVGRCIQAILYADDVVLLADNKEDLQSLLTALQDFCVAVGMAPNPDKCEVVVFNDPGWPLRYNNTAWVLNGTPLKKSKEFPYLGVLFTGGRAWREGRMLPAWVNQRNKGQRALHAFIDKCHSAHLHTPYVISKLYDTLVSTVGGYGCEIWGPGAILAALETAGGMGKNIFETSHNLFMRRTLHVGRQTCIATMRQILNRTPVLTTYLERALNFWNRVVQQGAEDLLYQCLEVEVNQPGTWGHQLIQVVRAAPCTHPSFIDAQGHPQVVEEQDIKSIIKAFVDREYDQAWGRPRALRETALQVHVEGSLVRACPDGARDGFKHFKFMQWREGSPPDHKNKLNHQHAFAAFAHSTQHVRVLSNFFCGNLWLECETGRQTHEGRSDRVCNLCHNRALEPQDEMHLFRCPAFESLHHEYPRVFESRAYGNFIRAYYNKDLRVDDLFRKFLTQGGADFWSQLGDFLNDSQLLHARLSEMRPMNQELDDFEDDE
jgi:hypothetical protein